MLFFLISCFSFFLISQSLKKTNPPSKPQSTMWPSLPCFFFNSLHTFVLPICRKRTFLLTYFQFPKNPKTGNIVEEKQGMVSLLDLPDLPLDLILEKLTPSGLFAMTGVCNSLREKCKGDYFWVKHLDQKWGRLIGEAAYREWQYHIETSKRGAKLFNAGNGSKRYQLFADFLGFLLKKTEEESGSGCFSVVNENSVMSLFLALESGKFWFPAQVLNRENGHVGFMLSCYDALLSYDSATDNFVARFSVQGRRTIEADIEWSRIRAPSVTTTAEALHITDCLNDLKPGDHIEIQWRRNKLFPYGWWYGVVGHLESCNGIEFNCPCHINDTVMLEFKQYAPGSRWRQIAVSRKDHREVGNEGDGFYGGIRKLQKDEEIAKWKQLWPKCTLE